MGRPKGSKNKPKVKPAAEQVVEVVALPVAEPSTVPLLPAHVAVADTLYRYKDHRAEVRAKIDAQKERFTDRKPLPFDPASLDERSVVDGKTVEEWDNIILARVDDSLSARKDRNEVAIIDLNDIPGWAMRARNEWVLRGRKRFADIINSQYKALVEKADENLKFALMDEKEAAELTDPETMKVLPDRAKVRHINEADKLLKQAKRKRDRSAALHAEASKLIEGAKS